MDKDYAAMLLMFEEFRFELMGKLADRCEDLGDPTGLGWRYMKRYKRWPAEDKYVYGKYEFEAVTTSLVGSGWRLPIALIGGPKLYPGGILHSEDYLAANPEQARYELPRRKRAGKRYMLSKHLKGNLPDVLHAAAVGLGKAIAAGAIVEGK